MAPARASTTGIPNRYPKLLRCLILRVIRCSHEAAGPLGCGTGLGEAGTTLACSSNFHSDRRERIKLPDGGNLEFAAGAGKTFRNKDPLSMQMSLRNKTQGGKSKRQEVTSVASSQVFFSPPSFPGGVSGWLRQMFADQIC